MFGEDWGFLGVRPTFRKKSNLRAERAEAEGRRLNRVSPFSGGRFQVANNQTDLVEPAVLGTLNVLRCARRTKSVKVSPTLSLP